MADDFLARFRDASRDARFVFWRDRVTPAALFEGLASAARELEVGEEPGSR